MKNSGLVKAIGILLFLSLGAAASADPAAQDSAPYINYRGQRKPADAEDFRPLEVRTAVPRGQAGEIVIDITFSQGIDPRSVRREHILLDSRALAAANRITFNREGTLIRLVVVERLSVPFSFSMENVCSYDGKAMGRLFFGELGAPDDFRYDRESGQWKKF